MCSLLLHNTSLRRHSSVFPLPKAECWGQAGPRRGFPGAYLVASSYTQSSFLPIPRKRGGRWGLLFSLSLFLLFCSIIICQWFFGHSIDTLSILSIIQGKRVSCLWLGACGSGTMQRTAFWPRVRKYGVMPVFWSSQAEWLAHYPSGPRVLICKTELLMPVPLLWKIKYSTCFLIVF